MYFKHDYGGWGFFLLKYLLHKFLLHNSADFPAMWGHVLPYTHECMYVFWGGGGRLGRDVQSVNSNCKPQKQVSKISHDALPQLKCA